MAPNIYNPTRMCIACKNRYSQSNLNRFQCMSSSLVKFSGFGRSFYICFLCIEDEIRLSKTLMRECKTKEKSRLLVELKEIITDGRQS